MRRGEKKSQDSTAWHRVSRRIEPFLRRGLRARAWESIHAALEANRFESDDAEFLFLHRATMFASNYGEISRAHAWIDGRENRRRTDGKLTDQATTIYRILRFGCELCVKSYEAAERLHSSIDWKRVRPTPWMLNLLLFRAVHRSCHTEVVDVLRRPCADDASDSRFVDPIDRALRLRLLGESFFTRNLWSRGKYCLRAAIREYSRDDSVGGRLGTAYLKGRLGSIASWQQQLEEAEAYLSDAVDASRRLSHPVLEHFFEIELAYVYRDREEFSRAETLLAEITRTLEAQPDPTGVQRQCLLTAYLNAADVAVEIQDAGKAKRHLEIARRLLAANPTERLQGFYHLVRGRAYALRKTRRSLGRALKELDAAERSFGRVGDGIAFGLAKTALARARVNLELRDAAKALRDVAACNRLQRRLPNGALQADCLVLKSQILVSKCAPRPDRLYEEVLGNLGFARNPIALFKVYANLYLYSWELDDHSELTVHHLHQCDRMAGVLDRPTFERLYEEHLTQRVMARAFERTLKVKARLS
jgi:tetratricopeptide (TPR) repeat protein